MKAAKEVRAQLEIDGVGKGTFEAKLRSATKDIAGLQQQLAQLKTEKNMLIKYLETVQQRPNQLYGYVMQLQAEKDGLQERDGLELRIKPLEKNEAVLAQHLQTAELERGRGRL